ncbi:hypothetical protein LguiA_009375 [Lonicera macranthoides]
MEGSESEAIFDSLNLNPQLFINEVLNSVDDLVDGAFDFFHQEAATKLKIEGTEKVQDLTQGVASIKNMVQSVLNQRLSLWESYCLHHSFSVPQGFSLPKSDEPYNDNSMDLNIIGDMELDAQLDSVRSKLTLLGKESAELNTELCALERQSDLRNHVAGSVNEALQLYEQHSMHEMLEAEKSPSHIDQMLIVMQYFFELIKTAPELLTKMEKLKIKRVDEAEQSRIERMQNIPNGEFSSLSNATMEELQEFDTMTL